MADLTQTINAISTVFTNSMTAFNGIAAKQVDDILETALIASNIARSLSANHHNVEAEEDLKPMVARLKELSEQYKKSVPNPLPKPNDLPGQGQSSTPSNSTTELMNQGFGNLISNLGQAMQNAVSNQQALNELSAATLAKGVNLILSANRNGAAEKAVHEPDVDKK
jgi:hypothetical protein